jgi:hypothetical protein
MPKSITFYLLISRHEDGTILSSRDRRQQQYLNTGWSIVGQVTVLDGTFQVDWFDPNYEEKWCFEVTYFARMTKIPILKEWFASRPSFPTFGDWLRSVSIVK